MTITAAFMAIGLATSPHLTSALKNYDGGYDNLVAGVIHYSHYAEAMFNVAYKAGFEVPGVFDYEVSEEFGHWFAENTLEPQAYPDWNLACLKLKALVIEFYINGFEGNRDKLVEIMNNVDLPGVP